MESDLPSVLGAGIGGVLAFPMWAWMLGYWARKRVRIGHSGVGPLSGDLVDVSALASATRSRHRTAKLAQATGAAILVAGLIPYGWPSSLLLVPLGAAVTVSCTVYFRRTSGVAGPAQTRRAGARLAGNVISLVAWLCGLMGSVAVTFFALASSVAPDRDEVIYTSPDSTVSITQSAALNAVLFIGAAALAAAVLGHRFSRMIAQADAVEAQRDDGRPPVLFLRSFADDRVRIPSQASSRRPVLESLTVRPTERFEEVVTGYLAEVGPVVAISDPRSSRRSIGASRMAFAEATDDWKFQIARWMDASALVVITAGATDGLGWELDLAAVRARGKLVILFPPVAADQNRARYRSVAAHLRQFGVADAEGSDPALLLALAVDRQGRAIGFTGDRRDESCYAASLGAAVRSLGLAGLESSMTVGPKRNDAVVLSGAMLAMAAAFGLVAYQGEASRADDRQAFIEDFAAGSGLSYADAACVSDWLLAHYTLEEITQAFEQRERAAEMVRPAVELCLPATAAGSGAAGQSGGSSTTTP